MTEKRFTDIEHDYENARIRCKDNGMFMLYAIYENDDGLPTLGDLLNEQEETIKGYKEILDLDKEDNLEVEHINDIYKQYGFDGVIDYATGKLSEYGAVREVDKGLWVMVTGGWSDHENWIHCLNDLLCMFGYKHYCGYVRGGAFYYQKDTSKSVEIRFKEV